MKFCTHCKQSWDAVYTFCPLDGTRLAEEGISFDDQALLRRFEFVAQLGEGPHGTLYLARHRLLGEKRTVKVLASEFASRPLRNETVRRFRIAKALGGPCAQKLFELEPTEKGRLAVEAEWIEGESLAQRLRSRGIAPSEATGIILRLSSVLAQAHSCKLLHLNLKPENVILRQGLADRPVLTDFIVGKAGAAAAPYLPPEAQHHRQWGPASDVCMLGGLALNLLGIPEEIRQDAGRVTAQLARLAGSSAARALAAAVQPEPADRPTMHELQQALNPEPSPAQAMKKTALQLRQGSAPAAQRISDEERQPVQVRRDAKRDWMWIVGIVAVAAALALFLLAPWPGSDRPPERNTVEGSDAQTLAAALPRPSVTFSHYVLSRPNEGTPSHHPHTVMTLNGFNLFVLRAEVGHPTTVERAQEANARLRDVLRMSGPDRPVRFSATARSEIRAHLEREEGGEREIPVLTLSPGDVVGYNRRSQHHLTVEGLAFWYRTRLQAFWDAFARAEAPAAEADFPEVTMLARIVQSAKAVAGREGIPLPEALQRALSGASEEDLNILQESVFAAPETSESGHHQEGR